jgi:hypothetical protein
MVFLIIVCISLLLANEDMRARGRAQDNNCMSNVKQLGLGLSMYAADNNYHLPLRGDDWQPVYVYVKNTQIIICPRDPSAQERNQNDRPMRGSYLLNPTAQADDRPDTIFAGDNAPDRHRNREWFGARADGAVEYYPATEWQTRLKHLADAAPPPARTGRAPDERQH